MSVAAHHFLADASPAVGIGLVPGLRRPPAIVLIVDDSKDYELASVLASTQAVDNGYGGAWSAQIDGEQLTIQFHLVRRGEEWQRRWTYPEPGVGVLDAITANSHHVAIVPAVGDLSGFVRDGNGGAIIIDVQPSAAVSSARALVARSAGHWLDVGRTHGASVRQSRRKQ
jgi:hypothetical protein